MVVKKQQLRFLFSVTLLNYAAQIPYYLHNYYFPYHVLPTASSIMLLGLTLAWFLVGYVGIQKRRQSGYYLLVTFLIVEALFYFHSLVFGAFFFQFKNPNTLIRFVFMYGYFSGAVAGLYAFLLIRIKKKGDK